jgi:PAS domain S-box-containing protein
MAALVQALDWSQTRLGPREAWSPALTMAVEVIMSSAFPMALRWGPDFVLIYNDGYRPILGGKHPAALGRTMEEAWPEAWPLVEAAHRAVFSGQSHAFIAEDSLIPIMRHKDQWENATFTHSYSAIKDKTVPGGIGGVLATAVETTLRVENERKLAQAVVDRTRERDRLWKNSQDILLIVEPNGTCRAVSPAWTRILGWAPEDIVGSRLNLFIHPDDAALASQVLARAAHQDISGAEARCMHKDGGWRWMSWVAAPDGDLIYASGRHISAEKQAAADLALTQEALRQSQKMDAIGQLTGGIAHDFNNMLAIIIGSLDIACRRLKRADAGIERYLENAMEGADRAAILTRRLLAFSRQSPLSPEPTVLNALVANMSELLRSTLGERIELETVLGGGLWSANIDRNQLESAIINLAVNARDAMPDGGKLTIETGNTSLDEQYALREIGVVPGQYVMLAVSDAGTGIAPDVLEKIFDPFFTTKAVGKGTGLGLSMVYGYAKQSGGHVRVYSELGRGTTVKMYLPRHFGAEPAAPLKRTETALPMASIASEIVLVVEDDDRVRRMSVDALRELGYTVHAASSGEEALAMFPKLDRVDLLFTDIMMGGINGRQLADALRMKEPTLKVVYTTGYTRNAVVHNGVVDPGVALLSKPFSVSELAHKIRSVLDS